MTILFTPLDVKGTTLPNRIVMPPMANNMADEQGLVTDDLIEHYVKRAKTGLGMIIVEHAYVQKEGQLSQGQLAIDHDRCLEGLKKLVDEVKKAGSLIGIQITHAGASAKEEIIGTIPEAPSAIARRPDQITPKQMSKDDIKTSLKCFAQAAQRAKSAGFDMVELHGAHGYLISQFNSPLTNQRHDEYGGSLENRFRFCKKALEAIRNVVGMTYPIWLRLGVSDDQIGGLTIEESRTIAPYLVTAGADCFDISGGLSGASRSQDQSPGYFAPWAREIKANIEVPVMVTGGITKADTAEQILTRGDADLIGIGRALLKDPQWAQKAKTALRN